MRRALLLLGAGLALGLAAACSKNDPAQPEVDRGDPTDPTAQADGGSRDGTPMKPPADSAPEVPPLSFPAGTWIPLDAGSFAMGSTAGENCRDADETQHQVTLTRGLEMAETEVTQEQFEQVMGYNPSFNATCGPTCPVEWVSWHEAAAYCNRLSAAKGLEACYACSGAMPSGSCEPAGAFQGAGQVYACHGYRLPTEAEFEYAARAGSTTALPGGNVSSCMGTDSNAGKAGWYKSNSGGTSHPAAGKAANAWGLYDLGGNVYEWVNDWYQADLGSGEATDSTGPDSGTTRVFRGGAWYFNAEHMRSADRESFSPAKRFTFLGFRCVRSR